MLNYLRVFTKPVRHQYINNKITGLKEIILKYLTHSISEKELNKLRDWLKQKKNQETFKNYIRDDYNLNSLYQNIDAETAFVKVWHKAQKQTKVVPLYKRNIFKYAVAVAVVIFATTPFLLNKLKGNAEVITNVKNNIKAGTDKAILTLNDGTNITLEKGQNYISENITSTGEKITYKNNTGIKPEIAYNYLTIPRGGQYHLELPDGTKVWLNSESKLKYPTSFQDGISRKVQLLYGEAYFDVSESTKHKGASFIVNTKFQDVMVLGTEFNIKAYNDEDSIYTTLVEGKVAVSNGTDKATLNPGLQSTVNAAAYKINVIKVDVTNEIAWKNGFFSFERKTLGDMLKILARWYDIEVVYENQEKRNLTFQGILKRTNNIEGLLRNIEKTERVKFEIIEKQIIVK